MAKCKGLTKLPYRRVISSIEELLKYSGLDVGQGWKLPCQHLGDFNFEFSTRRKIWVPSQKFEIKNNLCEKGDEITRFDGTVARYANRTIKMKRNKQKSPDLELPITNANLKYCVKCEDSDPEPDQQSSVRLLWPVGDTQFEPATGGSHTTLESSVQR